MIFDRIENFGLAYTHFSIPFDRLRAGNPEKIGILEVTQRLYL